MSPYLHLSTLLAIAQRLGVTASLNAVATVAWGCRTKVAAEQAIATLKTN